ncbi:MAG: hypothetical protein H6Q17_1333 [Bacteroidetes bacterium]|nr:hypothetical protein [Bacteroidota bacterium]
MNPNTFIKKTLKNFNLEHELDDFESIHQNISKDIVFKGINLWLLMFAIVIASVGLNMNSTAVIIGAMLISPLMGPINGMGYSIATYDFPLFRQSIKNFSFAVFVSLAASTLYFLVTPISTAHSELLARTSPTVYDVLIALFGGLAGIIAISSKRKGNVIPGVAIATALMPPLCTAGYGLATAHYNYFFGAIYLFTINTVFIALSSVAVSQILKFPIRTIVESVHKKKINRIITVVLILVLFPSIYFGYKLVQNDRFIEQASKYIANISIFEGNYLLKSNVNANTKKIKLVFGGVSMGNEQKSRVKKQAMAFALDSSMVTITQGLSFDILDSKNAEVETLKSELSRLTLLTQKKTIQIDSLEANKLMGINLLHEIKTLYPQIETCSYSSTYTFAQTHAAPTTTVIVLFGLKKDNLSKTDQTKIAHWLKTRLNTKTVKVFYEKYLSTKSAN